MFPQSRKRQCLLKFMFPQIHVPSNSKRFVSEFVLEFVSELRENLDDIGFRYEMHWWMKWAQNFIHSFIFKKILKTCSFSCKVYTWLALTNLKTLFQMLYHRHVCRLYSFHVYHCLYFQSLCQPSDDLLHLWLITR